MLCESLIDHQKDNSMPNKYKLFQKIQRILSHCECTACNMIIEHHKKDYISNLNLILNYNVKVEIST